MIAETDFTALDNDVADSFKAALEGLPSLLNGVEQPTTPQAILLCGFALLHQRAIHNNERSEQFSTLIEALDCYAARPDSETDLDAPPVFNSHQREHNYNFLKALLSRLPLKAYEYDPIIKRIAAIAGV